MPASALRQIGIKPAGRRAYELADGTWRELDIGFGIIELLGQAAGGTLVFAGENEEPLLGVTVLESTGFSIDPRGERLVPQTPRAQTPLDATLTHNRADPTDQRRTQHDPRRVHAAHQCQRRRDEDAASEPVRHPQRSVKQRRRRAGALPTSMSATTAAFIASSAPRDGGCFAAAQQAARAATMKTNDGRKIAAVASDRARARRRAMPPPNVVSSEDVADERRGRQQRPGRDLADGDRVEQLLLVSQP